jgi:hypothetical protein
MLDQHGNVGGAAHDGFEHPQHPLQREVWRIRGPDDLQHQRHELAQTLTALGAEPLACGGVAEALDALQGRCGIGKAGSREHLQRLGLIR